jgi:hypothetical protein
MVLNDSGKPVASIFSVLKFKHGTGSLIVIGCHSAISEAVATSQAM